MYWGREWWGVTTPNIISGQGYCMKGFRRWFEYFSRIPTSCVAPTRKDKVVQVVGRALPNLPHLVATLHSQFKSTSH